MVNKKGKEFLGQFYKEWLEGLSYDSSPSLELLEEEYRKIS